MPPRTIATTVAETLALWHERARTRRVLAQLDERTLRDLGLSRSTAAREAARPFWLP